MSAVEMLNAIYDKLETNASFSTSVGGRIFRDPPQEPAFPFCVFIIVSDPPDRYFGVSDISASIQISLYGAKGSGEAALLAIAEDLLADLDGSEFEMANHFDAEMVCQERGLPFTMDGYPQVIMTWNVYASTN